jgi:soluble lytic murein transglycosylase-like protein
VSNETAAPWPWALNRNGRTIYPGGPEAAVAHVRSSVAAGNQMIDVGLMQVNLRWHGRRVHRPEDLIDPVTNIQVGADILAESIASAPGDLALGVGRYHSWNDREAAYRYGRKVLALADLIKTTRGW